MVLDPESLYEVDSDVPDLRGAVLLHYFDGFVDAGSAGKILADHLVSEHGDRVIARFDVDQLLDYRSRRPPMVFDTDHWVEYEAPELVVHLLHDEDDKPFLLLTGPEPDHAWEAFTAAVQSLVERWEVRLFAGFRGIPLGVPHTRPMSITAHGTRPELIAGHRSMFNRLQVPGGVANLLEYRLGQAGQDAMGLIAHVPHYLAQSAYPVAAQSLADALSIATGLVFDTEDLREAAELAKAEVDRQVSSSEEVADVVAALERQYDTFVEAEGRESLLAEALEELPTADELGSEFERFLAEQQGHSDH
ncbi:MAG TPA: PAC2 family protein [Pseudonocardiaceae bacterium]|nr:PAC2 family protein [Pseudonocardiaceae bacterium]